MKAIYLTEDDAVVVRQLIYDYKQKVRQEPEREPALDDPFSPEVYVAEIPVSGIRPLRKIGSDFVPGTATCDIYRVIPKSGGGVKLTKTHFDQLVYNISAVWITGCEDDKFKLVQRDKFGSWVTECPCTQQTGTGTVPPTGTGTTGTGSNPTGTGTSTGTGTGTGSSPTGTGTGTGTGSVDTGTGTGSAVTGTGSATGSAQTGTGSASGSAATGTGSSTGTTGPCICDPDQISFPVNPYVGEIASGECTGDPRCLGGCGYTWNGASWVLTQSCNQP